MKAKELKPLIQKLSGGTIFSVTTIKRTDGTKRVFNCRMGVRKGVKGEGMTFDPEDRGLIVVFDNKAKDFRMINTDTIQEMQIRGIMIFHEGKFVYHDPANNDRT